MPTQRQVLEQLKRDELIAAVEHFELAVADRRVRAQLIDALAASRRARLAGVLSQLSRNRLKELCRNLGLDDGGREKAVLVERLTGKPPTAPPEVRPEGAQRPAPPRPAPRELPEPEEATDRPGTANGEEPPPQPGQIVQVRARRYVVEAVDGPAQSEELTVVHLACLDDDARGEPLAVLWEREIDAEILDRRSAWQRVAERDFDRPELFAAYYDTLRWHCATATRPRLFQAPYRAGIQVLAYQLEPLRKALALPRVNLFIADDVGLGKTIEAGLILRELLLRQKVRRVVVASPPSVVAQWRAELEQRFGLRFVVFDRDYVQQQRRERGFGVNPWATHSRFVISHALLRNESHAGLLRDWLSEYSSGSLLILDEAHHAAPSSGARYAIDSKLTRLMRDLAPCFEHRLFLSATPHNGHSNSFSALLELLDPQRFCRGVPVDGERQLRPILVRRLKEDLRRISGGFPEREVIQIDVDGLPDDAPELVLARLLDEYRALREERLRDAGKSERTAAGLVLSGLQKHLVSSIEAFASTLAVHIRTLERRAARAAARPSPSRRDLAYLASPPDADDEAAELTEEQLAAEIETQVTLATEADPSLPSEAELALLERMRVIAEAARHEPDPRLGYLIDWIRENMLEPRPDGTTGWNRRRVLIFTEYLPTKRYLERHLRAAIAETDDAERRIAAFVGRGAMLGSMGQEEIRRAFNADPDHHPLRILIANDAAGEGVNLQNHCADLFHFDLPWNPSRIEQRNGRIDRKLQRARKVFCRYFVFVQRPEDRVLQALVRKTKTVRKELGSLSPVIERRLAEMLEDVVRRPEIGRLCSDIEGLELPAGVREQVEAELEAARQRELEGELEKLRDLLEESCQAVGFDETRFRKALSCALVELGAQPPEPGPSPEGQPQRWIFPALDRRIGADPTWAPTLDTLRAPRPREMKLWQWRETFPIRPVVFADTGTLDADAVHLHLEHPVAQRLLHRFRGSGFADDQLSRATVLLTGDPQRRVILVGRLTLYGPGASRLHEEIVPVTARWVDPDRRGDGLAPYARDAEKSTLDLLDRALEAPRPVPEDVREILRPQVGDDVTALLPQLEERAGWREARARELLVRRGEREAEDLEQILVAQRRRIEAEVQRHDDQGQLSLTFNSQEARQLRLNQRHWQKRLAEIEEEIRSEPKRIAAGYRVEVARVEPVGIVYLWPISG